MVGVCRGQSHTKRWSAVVGVVQRRSAIVDDGRCKTAPEELPSRLEGDEEAIGMKPLSNQEKH